MIKNESTRTPDLVCSSPCVGQCCLDELDICLGCKRHIDEITGWHTASNEQKNTILNRCDERRAQEPLNQVIKMKP